MNIPKPKKVFVGLSGGVDSAVSAALLKEDGYDVTGVFIRTWHPEGFPCTEGQDEREAMRVAAHLSLPFKTLDLSDRYKERVGQMMIDGYAKGETPNPDTLCNREVKFGGFLEYAKEQGADMVATGHYAQIVRTPNGLVTLQAAKDASKDQSYFLAMVPHEELSYALFPIGHLHKSEVRELAKKYLLPNADRKDSQGICFLGALNLKDFLQAFIPITQGKVLSENNEVIGTHDGAPLYTVGERRGFHVAASSNTQTPLYVIATDVVHNTITVAANYKEYGTKKITLRNVVLHDSLTLKNLTAQVRYHGETYKAQVQLDANHLTVVLGEKVTVARGQVVVLYENETVVAAGEVEELA